jgi:intergrase/recombinase
MRMKINTLTETQRTKALNTHFVAAKPVNPYLFDVRKDKAIVNLLRECADYAMKVSLPVGAYLIERHEAVQNMYDGSELYVLVNAKGVCKYRDSGMDGNYRNWLKCVKQFLGIKD